MMFFLAALACYRLSRMIALEDGPWRYFSLFRSWIARKFPDKQIRGQFGPWVSHWLTDGVFCPLCLSFWLGLILAIPLCTDVVEYIYTALALSGAASLLYKLER